jgi:excisionase family DNA binding protein
MRVKANNRNRGGKLGMKQVATIRKFYTVSQIAEILQVSRRTVETWVRLGAIPFVRIGPKSVRFTDGTLDEIEKKGSNLSYKLEKKSMGRV